MAVATKTTEIFSTSRRESQCRHCDQVIVLATSARTGLTGGFNAPLLALRSRLDDQGRVIDVVDLEERHLTSCPAMGPIKKSRRHV